MKKTQRKIKKAKAKPRKALTAPSQARDKMREALAAPSKAGDEMREALAAPSKAGDKMREALAAPSKAGDEMREALAAPSQARDKMREALAAPSKAGDEMREALAAPSKAGDEMREALAGGTKYDQNKPMIGLIPAVAIEEEAAVFTFGMKKYGMWNWMKGITFIRLISAVLRHIFKWLSGEDNDQESGLPHLAHARAGLGMILHLTAKGRSDLDDRGSK